MKVEILRPAEDELLEAIAHYNHESEGLGYEFAAEVNRAISRVVSYPNAWTPLSRRTRRCRTNRFPYALIYQVRGNTILIVAVMHLRRDPESWKNRLRPGRR
jgi:plasmid stabilization system protein ParE